MARGSVDMNLLFTLGEVQRLVRAYADKQAAPKGIPRAKGGVRARVERREGQKQPDPAKRMKMHPTTLPRLTKKLCNSGWTNPRGDDPARRVNRLYLRKAA